MIDPIQRHYGKYPYPDLETNIRSGKLIRDLEDTKAPNPDYWDRDICVAGCGTYEPVIVAHSNKEARFTAVDVSLESLKIAQDFAKRFHLENLTFIHNRFEDLPEINQFDVILCAGVLHHVEDRIVFLNKAHRLLRKGGKFQGMVYCLEGRRGIRELADQFIVSGFSVQDVRDYFTKYPSPLFSPQSPDVEIADTWLNPRFFEYQPKDLQIELVNTLWVDYPRKIYVNQEKTKIYFELYK